MQKESVNQEYVKIKLTYECSVAIKKEPTEILAKVVHISVTLHFCNFNMSNKTQLLKRHLMVMTKTKMSLFVTSVMAATIVSTYVAWQVMSFLSMLYENIQWQILSSGSILRYRWVNQHFFRKKRCKQCVMRAILYAQPSCQHASSFIILQFLTIFLQILVIFYHIWAYLLMFLSYAVYCSVKYSCKVIFCSIVVRGFDQHFSFMYVIQSCCLWRVGVILMCLRLFRVLSNVTMSIN